MPAIPGRAFFELIVALTLLLVGAVVPADAAPWKPMDGPLKTRWTADVSPDHALPEYPRPQFVRQEWMNLNGMWEFAAASQGGPAPAGKTLGEQILVPYPVESSLSGLMRHEQRMWYRRTFEVPDGWRGKRIILHFGAVDWQAEVYLNGKHLGTHQGGYDPFEFDLTESLIDRKPQELIVGVFDPTNDPKLGNQPRGKQVLQPGGIMYTPTSGIWQTVWLEPVAKSHIESLHIVAGAEDDVVYVQAKASGQGEVVVRVLNGESEVAKASGHSDNVINIPIPHARLWSPDDPFLYGLEVQFNARDGSSDHLSSYFGRRTVSIGKDSAGITRILLNGKPVFLTGPLDQGFWPDGIYTAPTDAALKYDIEMTRKLGFNMTRKHVKVEPDRWYYWADKLGLLVWQDMPAGDNRTPQSKIEFERELDRMIETHCEHPSIMMWVVFNEGWGQFDAPRLTGHVKQLDPTRLVNNASGWFDQGAGDVHDMHHYPEPAMPAPEAGRAAVLGEFGGLGLAIPQHTWTRKSWGYRGVEDTDALTIQYERLLARGWKLREKGLCALVYTQLTDVETECNGLLTYDRQITKVDVARAAAVNAGHVENIHVPETVIVVPTARQQPALWRYTLEKPADDWFKPDFADSAWKQGPGGFGTAQTPGAVVNTPWTTHDIWIRREIEIPAGLAHPSLLLHHDDDAEVYLNGILAARARDYVTEYLPVEIGPEALKSLKIGKNIIAIHCHQNSGGQYIDAGIVDIK